jgi:p-hydroxybenzoate 3-monooxygenase
VRQTEAVRTQVAIIGAGPSGMLLAHLLHRAGIESVVVEQRSRGYVAARVRAGVLETGTVDVLRSAGLGERMERERYVHDGTYLSSAGRGFRIDFKELTGKTVTVYGQTEVQLDLYNIGDQIGLTVIDEVDDVAIHDADSSAPSVTFRKDGVDHQVDADFVAGCDGFHGVARTVIPDKLVTTYERIYPFGWLGILAETPPVSHELIYAQHERGFALCSMRNENLSRYYVQCDLDDDVEAWTDKRFWDELRRRIPAQAAETMVIGPSIEKSIAPLRSFVAEPMRFGNVFLAGDAAHIVPPTGAKGLNLAVADVLYLSQAIVEFYDEKSTSGLDGYAAKALARVWQAVRFSWWMTTLLHRFPDNGEFGQKIQEAELTYLATSESAQRVLAENYVGLPL